jgi:RNA 2',3'-cyclic 3'-phosphodiesterase
VEGICCSFRLNRTSGCLISLCRTWDTTRPDVSGHRERTGHAPQAPLPKPATKRLFIGIPLAATTAHDLIALVNRIRPKATDGLRWSAPESWHITLQFLGSTPAQQFECVAAHLRELRHPRLQIQLASLGTFARAGVLFVDVHITPQLLALQQLVTAATANCGFIPEDRPYHPHITLARRKGRGGNRQFRNLQLQITPPPHFSEFIAESFVLYESIPTPEGSRYEVRESFPLNA